MAGKNTTIPKGWKVTMLGEIAELSKSQWKPGDIDQKYIGLEHINHTELSINGYDYSSQLKSNKFRFSTGDVLFGKLRPYFRKVWKAKFDGVCSTDIWVMKARNNFDQNFLFYFVANPAFINKSMGASIGTHMPRADWCFLENTEWDIPPLSEQRAIAAVFSSFDDKIELLRDQNKTLEATAQAIFKEWFVNFNFPNDEGKPYRSSGGKMIDSELGEIPEGWGAGVLGDLVNHIKDSILPFQAPLDSFNSYSIPAFDAGRKPEILKGSVILSNKYGVKQNSFLVSKLNPKTPRVWTIFNVEKNSICSTEFQVIKVKREENFSYVHCFLNSGYFANEFASKMSGTSSSHQRAKPEDILNMIVISADGSVISQFQDLVYPMLKKANSNLNQIQTLSVFRDTLLPKLMKGEVRLKGFNGEIW